MKKRTRIRLPKVEVLRLTRMQILERIAIAAAKHAKYCHTSDIMVGMMLVPLLKDDDPVSKAWRYTGEL